MQPAPKKRSSQGMTLVVTLMFAALAITVLASLTLLVSHANFTTGRSQAWNQCLPVAEAGAEEALTILKQDGTAWGWTNYLATNGWHTLSPGITSQQRQVDGSNYYVVTINLNSGSPTIDSTGYVPFPNAQGQPDRIARKVEISTAASSSKLLMGLITSNALSLSGNVLIDSFDSSTNTGSTGGAYDPAKAGDQMTVATASTNANALEADGSCRIWGYLDVGPGGGADMTGVSRAGSSNYVGSSGGYPPGVDPTRFSSNFLFQYPAVTPLAVPTGGYSATFASLPTAKLGGTTYTVSEGASLGGSNVYQFASLSIIGSGNNPYLINGAVTNVVNGAFGTTANGYMVINTNSTYALYASSITLDGGPPTVNGAANSIRIGPNCNVLMVTSNFTITASGRLYIDPTSKLTIYAGGTVNLSGAGLINGATAPCLTLYGLPSCNSITVAASANFIGSIYAPSAAVSISGASPFYGSCIANSASLAGSGVFHFDQALNKNSATTAASFVMNHWQEVAIP